VGGDVAAVRQKVRELGQQLVALAALPPAKAPPSRLRKFLNRTKRVVRGLAVAAGVAVATVAISQVIMPAGAATAIAAAVVPLLPGHLITTSVVAEMVIEVTKKAVEFTLDSALKRLPEDAPGDQDPQQAVAQYAGLHLNAVALPQLGNLAVEWANIGNAKHADPPIKATRDLVGVTTMQIHVTAVATASIVSSPATVNLADQLDGVLALLAALDCSLGDKPVDASYVSATLTEVEARIETAQTQFVQAVHS
jgi:hypothetical protein